MQAPFLYEDIACTIESLIEVGTFKPGDRLPSVRKMSRQQGVSISTVLQAYRLLEDRHFIEARPQSGFYVRRQVQGRPAEPQMSAPSPAPTEVRLSDLVADVYEAAANPAVVPLGAAVPAPALLPTARLNRAVASAVREAPAQSNSYMAPLGYAPLRREIAQRALEWGGNLAADDVIITNGCMEAVALSLRAVARPGDTIAVESPAYFGVLQLIESLNMKALEVPTHPREGLCLNRLEHLLGRQPVRACLLSPNFQNPLGARMPEAKKEALVEILARYEVPVIEDDLYGDLYFVPPRPKSLLAYDQAGMVLHCSSFSKTLAPGYRIGWVVPGRFRQDVLRLKFASTIAAAAPLQMGLAAFLSRGGYDHHLRTLRHTLADNLAHVTQALCEHFPRGTRATRPQGGFVLWVELPPGVQARVLHRAALQHGISIAPGPIFSASGAYERCIRLSAGHRWSARFEEALQTLGRLAGEMAEQATGEGR